MGKIITTHFMTQVKPIAENISHITFPKKFVVVTFVIQFYGFLIRT
jgi:hypothetical protein